MANGDYRLTLPSQHNSRITKSSLTLLIILCSISLLAGCQLSPSPQNVSETQIEEWIKQGDFKQALRTLEQQTPPSQERISALNEQSIETAELEITYAKRLALQHQWKNAINHLELVIEKHPPNLRLSSMLASIRRQEKNVIREAEVRVLIQQAQWVLTALDKNKVVEHSSRASWITPIKAFSLRRNQDKIFDSLTKHFRHLDQHHPLSTKLFNTMNRLARTPQQKNLVETLKPIEMNTTDRSDKSNGHANSSPTQATRLFRQLNKLMQRGNLIRARETLSEIQDLDAANSSAYKKRLVAVEEFLNEQALHLTTQGDELYRKGHFEQARTLWMLSARLNPLLEETLAKIARSERVLKNLKDLRENDSTPELQTTE